MRRRELLTLPAFAVLPAPERRGLYQDRKVVILLLDQPDPFDQLDRLWRYGAPLRVVARAHPAWWPSKVELPDRWQAWVETSDGRVVRILCRPRAATAPSAARDIGAVSAKIASALRAI
ncbi:hypothetical protein [uncultured Paludibaculum sp.]|uniref:hypothetical protein n=1 Tax=uncultured Paludibaculum sp. TaxID=1765020 RepID=UPI002AABDA24|nr:hypothetical protein [uncultured Paludibaculum sp.]